MRVVVGPGRRAARPLPVGRWVALCAAAEAIGMTAAAGAAKAAAALGEPPRGRDAVLALSLVVAGGLVEGVALGVLQGVGLRHVVPGLRRGRWLLVTVLVAGLGWAAASAPGTLAGGGSDTTPPLGLVLAGAAALGVVMGEVLGAAQAAAALRGRVRHPWRWVQASAVAWAPTMAVVFLGATTPTADWSPPAVVLCGTVTGLLAGSVLGLVTGCYLPTLDGPRPRDQVVLWLLGSRAHRVASGSLVGLRLRGTVSGRTYLLPVQHARVPTGLVVVPGRPETKTWWRNLVVEAPLAVLHDGHWEHATGRVLCDGDPGYGAARAAYRRRWPKVRLPAGTPVVEVRLTGRAGCSG